MTQTSDLLLRTVLAAWAHVQGGSCLAAAATDGPMLCDRMFLQPSLLRQSFLEVTEKHRIIAGKEEEASSGHFNQACDKHVACSDKAPF
jgi:hypothetical protein